MHERWVQICQLLQLYLTDFLKTNLTKYAVIIVKRRQNAGFLSPRSSKITVMKEKERSKRKISKLGEGKEGKRKRNGCTLSFIIAALEKVFGRKKLLDARRSIW